MRRRVTEGDKRIPADRIGQPLGPRAQAGHCEPAAQIRTCPIGATRGRRPRRRADCPDQQRQHDPPIALSQKIIRQSATAGRGR